MKLLDKILVADDFTPSSQNVVENAIQLAKSFDSKIVLVHVLPDDIENEKVKAFLRETAEKRLEETATHIKDAGVESAETLLTFGKPYDAVVRSAEKEKANLVVTGSGERRKDGKPKLGTTAKRIIQQCEQPVLVVKEGTSLSVKKILCPVDFSETSRRALKNALTLAHQFGAQLIILNVVESPGTGLLSSPEALEREKKIRRARQKGKFERFLADFKLGELECKREIRAGDPSELILEEVARHKADLLVMGTAGRTGLSRWMMGSVAEKVGSEVPSSFIMLKSADVFQLHLESRLQDLETHMDNAKDLMEGGYYDEAIEEYKKCLTINNMHVPAYYGIARVYEAMGNARQGKVYRSYGKDILDRVWDKKIEDEIRKYYGK